MMSNYFDSIVFMEIHTTKYTVLKSLRRNIIYFWSRKWQPTAVFLPGKFHGQKRLAGYSP